MTSALFLFLLFAMAQGGIVIGLSATVFYYYLPKSKGHGSPALRWHILTVSVSYIGLTIATIVTASRGVYKWGDLWFWLVAICYIIGDISLLIVMRIQFKKHAELKNKNL